jgi:hypothetical protein
MDLGLLEQRAICGAVTGCACASAYFESIAKWPLSPHVLPAPIPVTLIRATTVPWTTRSSLRNKPRQSLA